MARKRARTKDGHFIADDPTTPENEAWVEEEAQPKKAKKKPAAKKAEPKAEASYHWYISSEPENGSWAISIGDEVKVRGQWDTQRQYVTWKVPNHLNELFKLHHQVWSGRIVPVEDDG